MMSRKLSLVSAEYTSFRDEKPPFEDLTNYAQALGDQINSAPAHSPARLIDLRVAADVNLDASCAPGGSEEYVDIAQGILETLIERTSDNEKMGFEYGVAAMLRVAELGQWRSAANGRTPENNYEELFIAVDRVLSRFSIEKLQANKSELVEVMPIIFGQRIEKHHKQAGWTGRLALLREESHRGGVNWDTSINIDKSDPLSESGIRLQMKGGKKSASLGRHRRAGVILIRARQLGFENPVGPLMMCIAEAEGKAPAHASLYLDDLTETFTKKVDEELHVIAEMDHLDEELRAFLGRSSLSVIL